MAEKLTFTLEYSDGYYVAMNGVGIINFEEPEDQAFAQFVVDALNASSTPFIDVTCGLTKTTDWKDYTLRMIDVCAKYGVHHYFKRDLQPYLPARYDNPMRVQQHH